MKRAGGGFTLLEVLITMLILVFGLLALANLQAKMNLSQMESYQRAQAVVLMQDMLDRIANNRTEAISGATYQTGSGTGLENPAGTGNSVATCTGVGSVRDKCEWSNQLLGASETAGSGGTSVGAMVGARGCVERLQAADTTSGVCRPAIYRVSVVWQGLNPTVASTLGCGQNQYGGGGATNDGYRRIISQQIMIGLPTCG